MSAVHRYAALNRPIGFATVPAGYVGTEARPAFGDGRDLARHGIVVYDRPLTAQEIASYELVPVIDPAAVDELVATVAESLGEYRQDIEGLIEEMPEEIHRCVLQRLEAPFPVGFVLGDRKQFVNRVLEKMGVQHVDP